MSSTSIVRACRSIFRTVPWILMLRGRLPACAVKATELIETANAIAHTIDRDIRFISLPRLLGTVFGSEKKLVRILILRWVSRLRWASAQREAAAITTGVPSSSLARWSCAGLRHRIDTRSLAETSLNPGWLI